MDIQRPFFFSLLLYSLCITSDLLAWITFERMNMSIGAHTHTKKLFTYLWSVCSWCFSSLLQFSNFCCFVCLYIYIFFFKIQSILRFDPGCISPGQVYIWTQITCCFHYSKWILRRDLFSRMCVSLFYAKVII